MLAFSGFRYGIFPPQAEIFEDIRTFLKRTGILLDVQIALNMKKNGARGQTKGAFFSWAPDGAIKSFNPLVCCYFSPRSGENFLGVFF